MMKDLGKAGRTVFALAVLPVSVWAQTVLYDSGGFEAPRFTLSGLEGQDSGAWSRVPGPPDGTGTVQSTTAAFGSQAVKILRSGQDVRYVAPTPISGVATSISPIVTVDWYMNHGASGIPGGSSGPFMGVEIFDVINNFPALIAAAGVDAATGQLVYQEPGTGFIVAVPSISVSSNAWHSYRIELDYVSQTYRLLFDGIQVMTNEFVDSGSDFSYARFVNVAAADDATSLAATGTVYFDNFRISRTSGTNAPRLRIDSTGGGPRHLVSWTPSFPGWVLQKADLKLPLTWSNAPSGPTNLVTLNATTDGTMYRVFKP